ncbi:hypothetical protein LTR62_004089 [Meristemomyces frigidus]|uniref:RCC1-like domain-containing protein n=1 Tax=Meristemomyces frigidus TaxID=1508187 RepID=A0AAN7YN66_9PEZI|nr:hypothetical protein LTR62_004089 [Meristemomyces frigidus]
MARRHSVNGADDQEDPDIVERLYVLGSNGSGQLMLEHNQDISTAQILDVHGSKVHHMAAGGNHTLCLRTNGEVTAHGSNAAGQCNILYGEDRASGSYHWSDVSATWTASILLQAGDGLLFVCGEGLHGELGLGSGVKQTNGLRQIAEFWSSENEPVQIASSMAHTVAVLRNGEVWGWGKNRQSQLGEPAVDVWLPRKIEGIPFPARRVVCGKDFTCIVGDPGEGKIHLLGLGKSDRFGLRSSLPPCMPGWKSIAASWGSMFIVTANEKLVGFGRNDHGQLPPPGLPPISNIAVGSEHCLALPQNPSGNVFVWGWGEHGNCGEPIDSNGDVNGRWNEIEMTGLKRSIFAGCATSFIGVDPT